MQKIIPHIWFDTQAKEAAEWYVGIFPDSKITAEVTLPETPSGDANLISLTLWGSNFQFISAGPIFSPNPSFSYMVACKELSQIDALWEKLSDGAKVLMPLGTYPFAERYGWLQDKYGVSWQIMPENGTAIQRITPCLLFVREACGKAEDAMNAWVKLFPGSTIMDVSRYGPGGQDKEGTLNYARFNLAGSEFVVMDSVMDHHFGFTEGQSLIVYCKDQAEIDAYWRALSAVPESEQCGWLKDRFGVSWQITPFAMEEMMVRATKEQLARLVQAFLPMKKLDIAALEKVYNG